MLGSFDGSVEGINVGEEDGRIEGDALGLNEGNSEGDNDGFKVGNPLGDCEETTSKIVGVIDGTSVESTKQIEQQSHVTSGEIPPQSAFTSALPHCAIVPVSILLSKCKCFKYVKSKSGTGPVNALLFNHK